MDDLFADDTFETVVTNASLEHDRCFWRTLSEIRRVLKVGGVFIVGVPGFVSRADVETSVVPPVWHGEDGPYTITYDVHGQPDYWRFSTAAVTSVLLEDMEVLEVQSLLLPPRLIGVGRKTR
jgi:SAM-dependent methyltransferase